MSIPEFQDIIEPNDQTEAREAHLKELHELVGNVYPNKFERSRLSGDEDTITRLISWQPVAEIAGEMAKVKAGLNPGERPPAEVKDALNERLKELGTVRVAGRLTTPPRGNFVHLTDGISKLQIYCKKGAFSLIRNDAENTIDTENAWAAWQLIDHGDFVGVEGYLFVTNTGEVSVHVEKLQFLVKALLPMPDKMHGVADAEIRQRKRYVDLIGSSLQVEHEGLTTRQVFELRAKTISSVRRFLEDHGYIEVETPMLTPKATGAAAKPFETHHNALDITLYARIAPELYLKRLLVGGFEKVYELNRNFRNEGISFKHNPEFTMLEFYCAYMDVNGMMDFCEELMRRSVQHATGGLKVTYEQRDIDFSKFQRISMKDAIAINWDPEYRQIGGETFQREWLDDPARLRQIESFLWGMWARISDGAHFLSGSEKEQRITEIKRNEKDKVWNNIYSHIEPNLDEITSSARVVKLFEEMAEPNLIQPTFIIDFPKSISPLSKASPDDPRVAERFELYINGMEVANGFSELNDPREQYERFIDQVKERERGDEEAMVLDEDYIRALAYGMPPAAGIGIGIDRLVMLLANKHSIRDVILFPHMRPEQKSEAAE